MFDSADGYVDATGSGLGIELNEDTIHKKAQTQANWHNPVWYRDNGNLAGDSHDIAYHIY
jgi:hypothetical protein